jgi:hypothetical protein
MKEAAVLPALLDRLAVASGDAAYFSAQQLAEWPPTLLERLRAAGLLVAATPAVSVICPGCEDECAMPVELATNAANELRHFVACDKREDTARVPVPLALLEQWQCTPRQLADAIAALLGLRRPMTDNDPARYDLGVMKAAKHSAHVVLTVGNGLQLAIAGHTLPVADVLELGDKDLAVDRRALLRCVDNPVAAAGDKESAEQRRERLRKRRDELKAMGEHHYNKVLAEEEGVTVGRIKQLLKDETADQPGNWFNLSPKGTTQKNPKPKR